MPSQGNSIDLKNDIQLDKALLIHFLSMTAEEKEMVRLWRNHEDVRKWMMQEKLIAKDEHEGFIAGLKHDDTKSFWLVKDHQGKYVGVFYLNKIDPVNKNAYFGMYANPLERSLGAGMVLDGIACQVAFQVAGLHTLRCESLSENKAVLFLHQKMGLHEEGRLKEFVFRNGRYQDVVIMGIVKPQAN